MPREWMPFPGGGGGSPLFLTQKGEVRLAFQLSRSLPLKV